MSPLLLEGEKWGSRHRVQKGARDVCNALGKAGEWAPSPRTSIFLFNRLPPSPLSYPNVRATERHEAAKGLFLVLKRLCKCRGLSAFPDNTQPRTCSEITNAR